MFAYEVTEEDVANVIRRQWVRLVNSTGVPFDVLGEQLLLTLDCGRIEKAALKHSVALEQQTDAAADEIERQLVEQGVLRPVATCGFH